ncbi:MAG TPA: cysteine synthase family protein, partial [Nitrososphaerales archaeon]|nr:cysteine synthase family protein [Nitrososphaerales archaeon]
MGYYENILSVIGNTPLVRLSKLGRDFKPTILCKLEFLNPGGSIKDRIGVSMLLEAQKSGKIKKGGTVVEPSSGNTGVGLALVCIILGFNLIVTMPDKMSDEKRRLLEAYGAKVIVCPSDRPPGDPEQYISVALRISSEDPNSFMPNQYENEINPLTHYHTTGKEIWEQTNGKITHFIAGIGTGGTISGAGRYLKEKNEKIKVVGVDPEGSLYYYKLNKEARPDLHQYKIEGIGEDFIPPTADLALLDEIVQVSDREAYQMARRLAREEALLAGSSSGAAVAGALKVAEGLSVDDL